MSTTPTPTPATLFSGHSHLNTSHFSPDTIIPPQTYFNGHIVAVWGDYRKLEPPPEGHKPRIALRLQCRIPISNHTTRRDGQADYIPPPPPGKVYQIKLTLRYPDRVKVDEEKLERDRQKIGAINGKEVQVDCSGMRVIGIHTVEGGKTEIEMLGLGESRIVKDGSLIKVLSDPPKHKNPPSWLQSSPIEISTPPTQPSSRSTIVKQFPVTAATRPTSCVNGNGKGNAQAGPSRLKPLSAHLPGMIIPNVTLKSKVTAMDRTRSVESAARGNAEVDGQEGRAEMDRSISGGDEVMMAETESPPVEHLEPNTITRNHIQQASVGEPPSRTAISPTHPPVSFIPDPPQSRPSDPESPTDLLPSQAQAPSTPPAPDSPSPPEPSIQPPAPNQMASTQYQQTEAEALAKKRRAAEDLARTAKRAQLETENAERAQVEFDADKLRRPLHLGDLTYTPIRDVAPVGRLVNIIGIVLEIKGVKESSKKDWLCSVVLTDPSNYTGDISDEDIVVTVFRRTKDELPANMPRGTVLLFRGLRINAHNGKPKGNAYTPDGRSTNTWAVISPDGSKVEIASLRDMEPSLGRVEVERMMQVREWWKGLQNGGDPNVGYIDERRYDRVGGEPRGRGSFGGDAGGAKVQTLGSVSEGMFFDATFKICHMILNPNHRLAMELYVTDGTISPMRTRNYHGIDASIPPSALFCLVIQEEPKLGEKEYFQIGNVLSLRNVRVKKYNGELELFWSDKVTDWQARADWIERRPGLVSKADERAKEIERRIKALKRGEIPEPVDLPIPLQRPASRSSINVDNLETSQFEHTTIINPPSRSPVKQKAVSLATHLGTTYTDPIDHSLSTFEEVMDNQLVPNRFRVRARVKSIISRGLSGLDKGILVQPHCGKCKRYFATTYCQSCNDTAYTHASYRYRFVIFLVAPDSDISSSTSPPTIAAVVADDEALAFLPSLPPFSPGPNEVKRSNSRIKAACNEVHDILLGARQDGERPHSVIEWTLECSYVKGPGKASEGILIHRVFGMQGNQAATV